MFTKSLLVKEAARELMRLYPDVFEQREAERVLISAWDSMIIVLHFDGNIIVESKASDREWRIRRELPMH
jgi:hypothetical protein